MRGRARRLALNIPPLASLQDPELKEVMQDIEENGQGAMMKYMQVRGGRHNGWQLHWLQRQSRHIREMLRAATGHSNHHLLTGCHRRPALSQARTCVFVPLRLQDEEVMSKLGRKFQEAMKDPQLQVGCRVAREGTEGRGCRRRRRTSKGWRQWGGAASVPLDHAAEFDTELVAEYAS